MANKEQLDAIKDRAMFNQLAKKTGEITHNLFTLDADDYDWLIEQAERVQELEKRLRIYQRRSWFEDYEKVAKQNKRYREALETIEMVTEFKSEANEVANKVLEESE